MILFLLFFIVGNPFFRAEAFSITPLNSANIVNERLRQEYTVASKHSFTTLFAHGDAILADDEPLSARFQRAVVLQRAGDHMLALKEYQTFVKAAEQCDVSPSTYAEVYVNMGAVYTKLREKKEARKCFESALQYREIGNAHVNLALLVLSEGQSSLDPRDGMKALNLAKEHCSKAVELNDDVHSVNGATRLLGDIEKMFDEICRKKKTSP